MLLYFMGQRPSQQYQGTSTEWNSRSMEVICINAFQVASSACTYLLFIPYWPMHHNHSPLTLDVSVSWQLCVACCAVQLVLKYFADMDRPMDLLTVVVCCVLCCTAGTQVLCRHGSSDGSADSCVLLAVLYSWYSSTLPTWIVRWICWQLCVACCAVQLVLKYFADMDRPMDLLSKQLWLILHRTIISVRMEPTIIVTVLRIIEREERWISYLFIVWWKHLPSY